MREKPRDNVALQEGSKQRKVDGRTTEDVRVLRERERKERRASGRRPREPDCRGKKSECNQRSGRTNPEERRGVGGGGEVAGCKGQV